MGQSGLLMSSYGDYIGLSALVVCTGGIYGTLIAFRSFLDGSRRGFGSFWEVRVVGLPLSYEAVFLLLRHTRPNPLNILMKVLDFMMNIEVVFLQRKLSRVEVLRDVLLILLIDEVVSVAFE